MKTNIYYLHAISPLHVGVGQAVGVVDLPIMREKSTHLPIVPGTAFKGVLRDLFQGEDKEQKQLRQKLFGSDTVKTGEESQSGAVVLGDARLLLLPVRSFVGVFAYVTCPFVLKQYAADCRRSGQKALPAIPTVAQDGAVMTGASVLKHTSAAGQPEKAYLEDLDLTLTSGADEWAAHFQQAFFADKEDELLAERLLIVHDDTFVFLAETATEVRARIRINDATGVVVDGALWYEENLPAESVLWGIMGTTAVQAARQNEDDVLRELRHVVKPGYVMQIGGKATVGRGLVRVRL